MGDTGRTIHRIMGFLCILCGLSFSLFAVNLESSLCSMENTLTCTSTQIPLQFSGGNVNPVTFASGHAGQAVVLNRAQYLFSPRYTFDAPSGTIGYWFKFDDAMQAKMTAPIGLFTFFQMGSGNDLFKIIYKTTGEIIVQGVQSTGPLSTDRLTWSYGLRKPISVQEWHHIAFSWQRMGDGVPDVVKVFIDGEELRKVNFHFETPQRGLQATWEPGHIAKLGIWGPANFYLGYGSALFGEVRIDDISFSPDFSSLICPDCSRIGSVVVFRKPLFTDKGEFSVLLPSTKPRISEVISEVRLRATPGEYEPVSFAVFSKNSPLNAITAQVSSLTSASRGVIDASQIDLRVVKVWNRAGLGSASGAGSALGRSKLRWSEFGIDDRGILDANMLVYNDQENLQALERYNADGSYVPPSISTTFLTSIGRGESKQFWVTVHVPAGTAPGEYIGRITLRSPNLATPLVIPIHVEVLPFLLDEPALVRSIYYRNFLDIGDLPAVGSQGYEKVSVERFSHELDDIRAHGFNGIQVASTRMSREGIEAAFRIVRQKGFVMADQLQVKSGLTLAEQIQIAQINGFDPIIYGPDEANGYTEDTFYNHLLRIKTIHDDGGKILNSLVWGTAVAYETAASELYDIQFPARGPLTVDINNAEIRNAVLLVNGKVRGTFVRGEFVRGQKRFGIRDAQSFPAVLEANYEGGNLVQGVLLGARLTNVEVVSGIPLRRAKPEIVTTSPDYAVIALPNEPHDGRGFERYINILNGREGDKLQAREMYYWQLGTDQILYSRYNTGVLAYLMRDYIYGYKPYAYAHQGAPGIGYGSPYDTFDSSFFEAGDGYTTSQMAVYPSQQGPIPTLEWEAVREGIDDLRYLTTLENSLDELRGVNPGLEQQLRRELGVAIDPYRHLNSWRFMSGDDFSRLRLTVIDLIQRSRLALGEGVIDSGVAFVPTVVDDCVDERDIDMSLFVHGQSGVVAKHLKLFAKGWHRNSRGERC